MSDLDNALACHADVAEAADDMCAIIYRLLHAMTGSCRAATAAHLL